VQVESWRSRLRIWSSKNGRSTHPSPQIQRNEGCAGSLTEAEKKVTPAEIEFAPPLRQAQRTVPRKITCKANLTSVRKTVKAGGDGLWRPLSRQ
jgi:hypothetical protein